MNGFNGFSRGVIAICLVAVSGCSSLSGVGGSSSLSCPVPNGSSCKPIGQVYQSPPSSNAAPVAKSANQNNADGSGHAVQSVLPVAPALARYVPSVSATRNVPNTGEPIRSATRTLKIWIAPWEDEEGALRDHGYLYVMVDSGKWQIEHSRARILREFGQTRAPKPLGANPAGSSSSSTGGSVSSSAPVDAARQNNLPSLPQLLGLPNSGNNSATITDEAAK
jgi:conjugal transfer pilus assembly protein TraV